MIKTVFISSIFFMFSLASLASFQFHHSDCKLRVSKSSSYADSLTGFYHRLLEEKGYKLHFLIDDKKLFSGELYSTFEVVRKGRVYKDCSVTVAIKKAKTRFLSSSDEVLYEKEMTRHYPRITFKGNERCRFALKEVFVHIPECKTN